MCRGWISIVAKDCHLWLVTQAELFNSPLVSLVSCCIVVRDGSSSIYKRARTPRPNSAKGAAVAAAPPSEEEEPVLPAVAVLIVAALVLATVGEVVLVSVKVDDPLVVVLVSVDALTTELVTIEVVLTAAALVELTELSLAALVTAAARLESCDEKLT